MYAEDDIGVVSSGVLQAESARGAAAIESEGQAVPNSAVGVVPDSLFHDLEPVGGGLLNLNFERVGHSVANDVRYENAKTTMDRLT